MSLNVEHSSECKANCKRWKDSNEFEALEYLHESHDLLHESAQDESLAAHEGLYGGRDVSISRESVLNFQRSCHRTMAGLTKILMETLLYEILWV